LQPDRDLSRSPLAQVKIEFGDDLLKELTLPGLQFRPIAFDTEMARYDLHLFFTERSDTLVARIVYATDLFGAKAINKMSEQLVILLQLATAEPNAKVSAMEAKIAAAEKDHQTGREARAKEVRLMKYKQVKRRPSGEPELSGSIQ
jgi:non-ribosomal peptide synthetase component F